MFINQVSLYSYSRYATCRHALLRQFFLFLWQQPSSELSADRSLLQRTHHFYWLSPSSSTTSQEVYSRGGIKKVSNTTRGNSIATQIGKQTAQKKAAAKAAAQKKAAPKGSGGGKPTQKSKNGYKNTKKLGL